MTTTLQAPPPFPPAPSERPGTADGSHQPVVGRRPARDPDRARWVLPALVVLLVGTAAAYLWDLSASGYANSFYAAAVRSGTVSWKAFFFGSIDSSNYVTVDKSPASLWVMELSGRLVGFSSWTMLVPQVLEGVAAVALLFAAVRRWFGAPAGLVAGTVLACTPVAALMFRFNNPDALMVLALVAAAYTLVRALERAGTRWIVATGALLGFAFLAKMLQAFTVLPAFAGVYLLAAPTALRRRIGQLALLGVSTAVAAGWWVATVALWPATSRPYIDGSSSNSIIDLIFGYNGLQRLSGGTASGGGFSGSTGVFRLFNDMMGGQASWLLPAALLALVAGLGVRWRAPRTDRVRAAFLLWGGWLVVTGAVFSLSSGVIHTYYTVALAPAVAALVAMGGAVFWRYRDRGVSRVLGAVAVVGTSVWACELLGRTPGYLPWLRWTVVVVGTTSGLLVLVAPIVARWTGRLTALAIGLGLVASLGGPIAYTATTITTPHTGSIPSAGPVLAGSTVSGPGGAAEGTAGGPVRAGAGVAGWRPSLPGGSGPAPSGTGGPPSGTGGPPSGTATSGGSTGSTGGTTGPNPGAGAGPGGAVTADPALDTALRSRASSYRWAADTFGSVSAASLELTAGVPVMAIGGFNGQGGNLTLAQFQAYVAKGEIHWFLASGTTGEGPGGRSSTAEAAITSWVASHFAHSTIGGRTVYDLTART